MTLLYWVRPWSHAVGEEISSIFNPLNTSWTLSGSSGPVPGPLKEYTPLVNFPARGDPWAMKMWVFLGSLHAKEPPKIESGQKFILEPEIWPEVQS